MKCLNRNVVIGLAAVAVALVVAKPSWLLTALPLLILAACPLSMMIMMRHMSGQSGSRTSGDTGEGAGTPSVADADQDRELRSQQPELTAPKADQAQITNSGATIIT